MVTTTELNLVLHIFEKFVKSSNILLQTKVEVISEIFYVSFGSYLINSLQFGRFQLQKYWVLGFLGTVKFKSLA